MTKKPLTEPKPPLKIRVPREGPSPREYELLELQRLGTLTEAEANELRIEQDTRTDIDAQWAQYHEDRAAYERAQRQG